MKITGGVQEYQVLQRDAAGYAVLRIEGEGGFAGRVSLAVSGAGWSRTIENAGKSDGRSWSVQMEDVPTGGPYRAVVSNGDNLRQVENIFVGDVWVLAGQSNMEGVGDLVDVEPPHPLVQVMDLADQWRQAEEPLHWLFESVDSAHWPCEPELRGHFAEEHRRTRIKGTGLGLPFGRALSDALGTPVGLLACARGGTSMQQWSPALMKDGRASLYGSMVRRIKKVGGVRGILWYQGESDANPADSREFATKFRLLIESLRAHVERPELPFLFVQLSRFVAPATLADLRSWNAVQEAQRKAAVEIPHTEMVAAIDLELDDAIHVGTAGLRRLGRRLAAVARTRYYQDSAVQPGPRLQRISVAGENRDRIEIEYAGVNGSLRAPGRLGGFTFRDLDGHHVPLIYKQEIHPSNPCQVRLWLTGPFSRSYPLHYGWGRDPYCNLVDEQDLAAPVFGPVFL